MNVDMKNVKTKAKCLWGIDLDGICFDFLGGFSEWLNKNVGIAIPEKEEITSYYWHECVDGLGEDVFWDEFDKFGLAGGYRNLKLLPGAYDGLCRIAEAGHDVIYITNRPKYAYDDTMVALRQHRFPNARNVHFAHGAKAPVIREHNVDIFIDDSPRTIAEICENTDARIYCMDYPMNRDIHDVTNYTRVKSWEEFLEKEGICGGLSV